MQHSETYMQHYDTYMQLYGTWIPHYDTHIQHYDTYLRHCVTYINKITHIVFRIYCVPVFFCADPPPPPSPTHTRTRTHTQGRKYSQNNIRLHVQIGNDNFREICDIIVEAYPLLQKLIKEKPSQSTG